MEQDFIKTDEGSYATFIGSTLGSIEFDTPGDYYLTLEPESINSENNLGFTLRSVIVSPTVLNEIEDKTIPISSINHDTSGKDRRSDRLKSGMT